ncbi:MAG: hypothetical protein QOF85_1257 [Solirubrobacterales bacterium]|jgi:hypothetical protein|nr:hypothetical protein [Solirubrobacterales bacterium]
MASPKSEQGSGAPPAVDPIRTLGRALDRFAVWLRRAGESRVAYAALALSFLVAAALILDWGKGQTFINDEWTYLVVDQGWSLETVLKPQNGHLIAVPLLIYKGLFATFGAESHLPFQLVTVILHLAVALLFFLLVRSRTKLGVAVGLTVLVAFFGAGWDTLMGAYELPNLTGMAAGLGMLLALERRTRSADILASLLLATALASFSIGIAFGLGALLSIWLGGRAQWRRAWIVLFPAALYVAWFVWARKFGQSEVTAEAVSGLFSGIADQVAAICAGITGLFRAPGSADLPTLVALRPEWGYPLAPILLGLTVLHVRRNPPRSIRFWTIVGTLLAYLALVAVGLDPARAPNASRYVYMGGILILLLVAELSRDVRWSTVAGLLAFVVFGLALMANVSELRAGGRLFEAEGATNRATLAALELSRDRVKPDFFVEDETAAHSHPDMFFPASAYFDATAKFGSPAFSVDQLLASAEQAREAADQELVRALELAVVPLAQPAVPSDGMPPKLLDMSNGHDVAMGACTGLVPEPGRAASFRFEIPAGGFRYRTAPDNEVELKLSRFGEAFSTALPPVVGSGEVAIPPDASQVPWRAELRTTTKTLACRR